MSEPTPGAIPQQPLSESEAKQWAGLSHLLGGIFSFIAPLIIWLVYKDRNNAYLNAEAKKALNFTILVAIAAFVSYGFLSWLFIGFLLGPAVQIAGLVYGIINFSNVNAGKPTSYPLNVAIVK